MPSFNLLTEPFISAVRFSDGKIEEIGLMEALTRSKEFREIYDPLATVEFGLYRLCIALLLDIFFLEPQEELTVAEIEAALDQGCFDEDKLQSIRAYAVRYHLKFDLFSETCPFLQTAGMTGEDKPVAGLLHTQPSGTNSSHFAHGHEIDFGISPAAAARLLATVAPFMTAGGAGLSPSINGAPPIYALVRGENLYETLWLNLYAGPLELAKKHGKPAWHGIGSVGGGRKTGASYAESLTWMPRGLRFIPGAPGRCALTSEECPQLIRTMKFVAGDACDFAWLDPNCAYRIGDKGRVVMRMREGRALWRDTGPLALMSSEQRFLRPALIRQAADVIPERSLNLILYGLRTDMKMKIFEWQREELSVPKELIHGTAFAADALEAMDQAEKAAYYLRQAIKIAYPRSGKGNKNAFQSLIDGAERDYWSALRRDYEKFLSRLTGAGANDSKGRMIVRTEWVSAIKTAACQYLNQAIDGLDTDDHAMERQARAIKSLYAGLYVLFLSPEEHADRAQKKKNKTAKAANVKIHAGETIV